MLTDSAIRAAKPRTAQTVKLSDGGGLQLWVQPSGSKLWNLAYRFAGKQPQASHRFISAHWIERGAREAGRGQEDVGLGFRSSREFKVSTSPAGHPGRHRWSRKS
jgi:Arm DNA-binding domain